MGGEKRNVEAEKNSVFSLNFSDRTLWIVIAALSILLCAEIIVFILASIGLIG